MNPKIYVACLASYNNGKLYGKWIDANQDVDALQVEISALLKASPELFAEEWAVHDYEGFGEIHLSEWPDLARVSALAGLLEEHGEAFSLWYCNQDSNNIDVDQLEDIFQEQNNGIFESKEAFADYILESTGMLDALPEWAKMYFNYEAYARDLELSGDYSFIRHASQIYVFSNH